MFTSGNKRSFVQENVSPFEVRERERVEQRDKFWVGKLGESFEGLRQSTSVSGRLISPFNSVPTPRMS
jgi:hypothetical protein